MISRKKRIIKILSKTYCRLKPSYIGGVGVFAIRNIPKGIDPFNELKNQVWYKVNINDLKKLDKEILKMVDDFFVIEKNGDILVPSKGLNGMDMSFYVNHSEKPNLKCIQDGSFKTIKPIKKDQELTVSYGTYDHKWKKLI